MTAAWRIGAGLGLAAATAAFGPAAASIAPLRRTVTPGLAGIGPLPHVALTYDDGPDPCSTPAFLELLARHDVRATFFVLGEHAFRHQGLVRTMADAGHELAVHGWDHQCVVRTRPAALREEIARTAGLLGDLTGAPVRWYRPPYGVLSTAALRAADAAGLRTVLWSAWGRDWERRATPARIVRTVESALRPGGTVLLHDTDRQSAPGSWTRTLPASNTLLTGWAARDLAVGPLDRHGVLPGSADLRDRYVGA